MRDVLYLIGLSNGRIKVGHSRNIEGRLKTHRSNFKQQIEWTHIFCDGSGTVERAVKIEMSGEGRYVAGMTEIFSGLSKERAIEICRRLIAEKLYEDAVVEATSLRQQIQEQAWESFKASYGGHLPVHDEAVNRDRFY